MNPTLYLNGKPVYELRDPSRPIQRIMIVIYPDADKARIQWGQAPYSLDHEYISGTLARVILEIAESQGLIFPPENMSA